MQVNFKLVFPDSIVPEEVKKLSPMFPFCEGIINFLGDLGSSLLNDKESRKYPDVITFAYFCRKTNLLNLKKQYSRDKEVRLGRGVIFHIAPSNVPLNFGYSLVAGLLAGNANIVRLSSKDFPQVDHVVRHIEKISSEERNREIAKRVILVRYDRSSDANAFFSSLASVRVIWGGDSTISAIRENELPPRSFDVCFADRYSIAVISAKAILEADETELKKLANAFYNDTYLFDQNACSAPRTVFWLDDGELEKAKKLFWQYVHDFTVKKYNLQPVLAVDKLTTFYTQAVNMNLSKEEMEDNVVMRVNIKDLPANIDEYRCAGGYFCEKSIISLKEITEVISPKYQTLAYFGIEKDNLQKFIEECCPDGIDRIVPIGATTDFSLTWDGYDLIQTLSRIVSIS